MILDRFFWDIKFFQDIIDYIGLQNPSGKSEQAQASVPEYREKNGQ
jgi:hypothetical protein